MRNIIKENKVHYIWVKTKTDNYNKLILKIQNLNINIYDITYERDYILLNIKIDDFSKLKKYLISYKFKKVKDIGIFNFKNILKKYNRFLCAIIFGLLVVFFLSNIIVKVNVIHSKKEIRELVTNALEERGIKRLTFKKKYDEIQKIKSEILEEYKDRLEWIEIETDGMIYNIRIEERIITDIKTNNKYCHIVADKSGVVTKIVTYKGVANVGINKYVSKGDILISGEVKLNEEVKNNVCAEGFVYGEVWYTVNVSLPLNYEESTKTGKMRYNLMYEDEYGSHVILKSRLKTKEVKNEQILSLLGRKLYLQKEYETIVEQKTYTEEEALNQALSLALEKVNVKLEENEKVISQKVLKKSINNSKMELEVFTSVEEKIGVQEEYIVELAKENSNDLENTE